MLAILGVSFLTPLDALFVLAAAAAARRAARSPSAAPSAIRRLLSLHGPGRRAVVPVASRSSCCPRSSQSPPRSRSSFASSS